MFCYFIITQTCIPMWLNGIKTELESLRPAVQDKSLHIHLGTSTKFHCKNLFGKDSDHSSFN